MQKTCLKEKNVDIISECEANLSSVGLTLVAAGNVWWAFPSIPEKQLSELTTA